MNASSGSTSSLPESPRWWPLRAWVGPLVLALVGLIAASWGLHNLLLEKDAIGPWSVEIAIAGVALVLTVLLLTGIARYRADQRTRDYLRALESLQQVAAAISARIGQGPVALQQVTDAARDLLRMSMACIMIHGEDDHVTVITASGVDEPIVGRRWPLEELRAVRTCIRENRLVWISDVSQSDKRIHPDAICHYGVRAFLVVPLEVEGRTLGALAIADRRARHLRDDEMRLARLWAAHAAVILQNGDLYQRMESALLHERQVQAHRDLLVDLSITLYEGQPLETALQRLSDRAPRVLGVDLVCFGYYRNDGTFEFIAATQGAGAVGLIGKRFAPGTLQGVQALKKEHIVCIDNVTAATVLNPELKKSMRIGSIMFVPMFGSDGAPLAVMSLVRHHPGSFSRQQQGIATNLADRIAAAIEGVRLHERIRNDAQTKTILLRELHHRVKNNLAGIVSLLSINQPELPQPAQQWLNRVVDRIGLMARAHELFTNMPESLSLREVIRMTVSSLSVVVPPTVRVQTDVDGGDQLLTPDRAVALAMVLHELAHNAIAYGTSDGGAVVIHCFGGQEPVRIEVIDGGRSAGSPQDAASSQPEVGSRSVRTGIGLDLVRGLVASELHGTFMIDKKSEGGTTAAIAFSTKQCDVVHNGNRR